MMSLYSILNECFDWDRTPEGYEWWKSSNDSVDGDGSLDNYSLQELIDATREYSLHAKDLGHYRLVYALFRIRRVYKAAIRDDLKEISWHLINKSKHLGAGHWDTKHGRRYMKALLERFDES